MAPRRLAGARLLGAEHSSRQHQSARPRFSSGVLRRRRYGTQEDFRMSKALRVLITGAARGIGMATAQLLANRGHWVVATDVSALSGLKGIQAHALDVTSGDSVARCLNEVGPL